jgi:hypothetical protein
VNVAEETTPTWIVLARDVSESVAIPGQRRTFVAAVLDVDTGLIVHLLQGTSIDTVVPRVLKGALTRPSAPLTKAVPNRLIAPPELVQAVGAAAAGLSKLASAEISEGLNMHAAEEILDALVGHLEGREPADEPPAVEDWQVLYAELAAFAEAALWKRWSDVDWFHARFELDGMSVERDCLVLGNAGVQHGFNVMPDASVLSRAAMSEGPPRWEHLDEALIVHLDTWRETGGLFADKARRYGWSSEARLVPSLYAIRKGRPADVGRTEARMLALALRGVVAQDSRRLISVGDRRALTGEIAFVDGIVGRFEVDRP